MRCLISIDSPPVWGGRPRPPFLLFDVLQNSLPRETPRICTIPQLKINFKGVGQACPTHTANPLPGGCPSTCVTSSIRENGIKIHAMRFSAKTSSALTLCGFALSACFAQSQIQPAQSPDAPTQVHQEQVYQEHVRREHSSRRPAPAVLSPDDGLSVIAAALDARVKAAKQPDCSHLVHAIYLQAGFPYPYASSSDLYDGTDEFQKVTRPQPGDLVVWPGHVGIVVNPAQRAFFSRLRHGPGIDAYDAQYWKQRGQVRFFRYIKRSSSQVTTTRLISQRHK